MNDTRQRSAGLIPALASGLVALLALIISGYTVYVQRQQLKVQAWPRLALIGESEAGANPTEKQTRIALKNRGVAPAEVRNMRVRFESKDLTDWREWLIRVGQKLGQGNLTLSRASSPTGEIVGVGEEFVIMTTGSERTLAAIEATGELTQLSICYCSVLDDCWVLDTLFNSDAPTTTPVDKCPSWPRKFAGTPEELKKEWAAGILNGGDPSNNVSDGSVDSRPAK